MAVLNARDIATQQTCALLDVPLAKIGDGLLVQGVVLTDETRRGQHGRFRVFAMLTLARRVGVTMTELGEEDEPNPLYRYYRYYM